MCDCGVESCLVQNNRLKVTHKSCLVTSFYVSAACEATEQICFGGPYAKLRVALSFTLWKGTSPPGLARSKPIRRSTTQDNVQNRLHHSAQIGAAESVEDLLKAGADLSEPSHAALWGHTIVESCF